MPKEIEMMHYEDVEMSLVQDGTYEAEVITDLVRVKVQVSCKITK